MKTILVVCTGNSCRSPMAEGYLRRRLQEKELTHRWRVISRGVSAADGLAASEASVEVCMMRQIDISGHLTRRLSAEDVRAANLIIAMEGIHRESILSLDPEAADRIVVLNIPDPITFPADVYERVFESIRECIDDVVRRKLS